MKRIEAVMNAFKLDEVCDVLKRAGIDGMTISEVRALVPQSTVHTYRGVQYLVDYSARIKVEVVVDDAQVATVLGALEDAARTGELGVGTVVVSPVEEVIRIRTGERDRYAIDHVTLRSSRAA